MNNMHVKSLFSESDGIAENERSFKLFDGLIYKNDGGASIEIMLCLLKSIWLFPSLHLKFYLQ